MMPSRADDRVLRLVNFILVDGIGRVFESVSLEARGGVITTLTTGRERLPSAEGAMDLEGRFMVPGLFDCHVHITADASADPVAARVNSSPGYLAILGAMHARQTLAMGVTTVRDTGAPHFVDAAVKRAIETGIVVGPRFLSSGKMLTMTGGHGCLVGQEVDGADEARKYARLNLKMGADNIKMVASGGIMTPNVSPRSTSLCVEELAAGFEEAAKANKLSACHAHSLGGVKNALKAGVRTIEHGVWLDEEACQMMIDRGAYLCPTLSVVHNLSTRCHDPGVQQHVREKVQEVAAAVDESFRLAREMGVSLLCGTDAGMPFTRHGDTFMELSLMVDRGVSPLDAITIATSQSARGLRLDATTGSVEVGKQADLLVTDDDPLEDIRALGRPTHVFKGGRRILTLDRDLRSTVPEKLPTNAEPHHCVFA